jgi:hypothetical protein
MHALDVVDDRPFMILDPQFTGHTAPIPVVWSASRSCGPCWERRSQPALEQPRATIVDTQPNVWFVSVSGRSALVPDACGPLLRIQA